MEKTYTITVFKISDRGYKDFVGYFLLTEMDGKREWEFFGDCRFPKLLFEYKLYVKPWIKYGVKINNKIFNEIEL